MKTTLTSMAIALLFAITANADVIHTTDFEADGAAQGAAFDVFPNSFSSGGGGGDHIGNAGIGLSDVGFNSSFSYVIDTGATADNGNGWGATWGGIAADADNASGGFTSQANAVNDGDKYIDFADGLSFTSSVQVATDPNDPANGGGLVSLRYEFFSAGVEVGRIVGTQIAPPATGWQQLDFDLTIEDGVTEIFDGGGASLGAIDLSTIDNVGLIVGGDGFGFGAGDGLILVDDFSFEVDDAFVVTVAVPEPSSAVILAGLLGLCGLRRKKN